MASLVEDTLKAFRNYGMLEFIYRSFRYLIFIFVFTIFSILIKEKYKNILIILRSSNIDSDTIAILTELDKATFTPTVYLGCKNADELDQVNQRIPDRVSEMDIDIVPVYIKSTKFLRVLSRSSFVYIRERSTIKRFRMFDQNQNRIYAHCDHGIVTKAMGCYKGDRTLDDYHSNIKPLVRNIDIHSVESDIQLHYKASALGLDPKKIDIYGYPRYDRIRRIRDGIVNPILPEETREELNKEKTKILYAPTYSKFLDPYPFSTGTVDELRTFLKTNDIEFYVRMHIGLEESGYYDDIIDGTWIKYAGHKFSQPSIEILDYFDILVTDYSSIYMEYLPFDRPIIFLNNSHEEYVNSHGLGFDYDRFFPGKKLNTLSEFENHTENCLGSGDGFEKEREFVRKVFLHQRDQPFLESTYYNIDSVP